MFCCNAIGALRIRVRFDGYSNQNQNAQTTPDSIGSVTYGDDNMLLLASGDGNEFIPARIHFRSIPHWLIRTK